MHSFFAEQVKLLVCGLLPQSVLPTESHARFFMLANRRIMQLSPLTGSSSKWNITVFTATYFSCPPESAGEGKKPKSSMASRIAPYGLKAWVLQEAYEVSTSTIGGPIS